MNPNNTVGLSGALCLVLIALAALNPAASILIAVPPLTCGVALWTIYLLQRRTSGDPGLPPGPRRPVADSDASVSRRSVWNRPDIEVLVSVLAAGIVPLIASVIAATEGPPLQGWLSHTSLWTALGALVAAIVVVVYVSTLTDWYYTLPRLAGLIGDPPCRRWNRRWVRVTRNWYLHRWFARLLPYVFGAAALGVALNLVLASFATNVTQFVQFLFALVPALLATLVMVGIQSGLHSVSYWSNPTIAVGRLVRRRGDAMAPSASSPPLYYVVDVSSEGIKVIEVANASEYGGVPFWDDKGVLVTQREELLPEQQDYRGCDVQCSGVNFYCENNWRAGRYAS
jgi:hypothetical protein